MLITTTPRPIKCFKALLAREGQDVVVTRSSSYANRENLPAVFFAQIVARYAGTRLAKQEIDAELLTDTRDLETLLGLLDPDIWGDVDLGPLDARTGQTRRGALQVATNFLRYFGSTTTLVSNPVAGPAVVLAFAGQRLTAVILLTIDGERVRKIHVIADPAKVGFLSSQLGTAL